MPRQSRNAFEYIHSKGYLESFTFDNYIYFFPFPAFVYKKLTVTEFLGLWGSTGEAIPHHQRDGGAAWWEEAFPGNLHERKWEESNWLKPGRTQRITFCKADHKFAKITCFFEITIASLTAEEMDMEPLRLFFPQK